MTPFSAATRRRSEVGTPPESNRLLLPRRHRRRRKRKGYTHAELGEAGEWSGRAGEAEEKRAVMLGLLNGGTPRVHTTWLEARMEDATFCFFS